MLVFASYQCLWGKEKKVAAQAVTSWNKRLTYKGVSVRVSVLEGWRGGQQDKNTPGGQAALAPADHLDCCQMRKAKLSFSMSEAFSQWKPL